MEHLQLYLDFLAEDARNLADAEIEDQRRLVENEIEIQAQLVIDEDEALLEAFGTTRNYARFIQIPQRVQEIMAATYEVTVKLGQWKTGTFYIAIEGLDDIVISKSVFLRGTIYEDNVPHVTLGRLPRRHQRYHSLQGDVVGTHELTLTKWSPHSDKTAYRIHGTLLEHCHRLTGLYGFMPVQFWHVCL